MGDFSGTSSRSSSSSVFASPDIATLVANFPPLSISDSGRPVVVRSFTGTNLKSSNEVIARFKQLVETSDKRILKGDLSSVLGIERNSENIVLEQLHPQLYYSRDGRSIIPHPLVETIAGQLKSSGSQTCVDLHAFGISQDIGIESLNRMIEVYTGKDWPRVIIDVDETSFLCSYEFAENVKIHIINAIADVGSDICDLSEVVGPGVPGPIIVALATEATSGKAGEVRLAGDHVVYIPEGLSGKAAMHMNQLYGERSAGLVSELHANGYCMIHEAAEASHGGPRGDTRVENTVIEQYGSTSNGQIHIIDLTTEVAKPGKISNRSAPAHSTKLLVEDEVLKAEMAALGAAVETRTEALWRKEPASATPSNAIRLLQPSDYPIPHKEELAKSLVRSQLHAEVLESVSADRLSELEGDRSEKFVELIEAMLWGPLHLYAAGVLASKDPTLQQNLEAFVIDHFKREVVPHTFNDAKNQGLLNDRTKKRECDKLQQDVEKARNFEELQKAVAKFGRKLHIATPGEDLVVKTKHKAITQAVRSMQKLNRGSDILQNLIWVLLATSGPGLFMSSGKDTSRMIRQYDTIGDTEVTGMLNIWRDKLKGGMEDEEDIRQMKELASAALEEWEEGERVKPYSGT
ncbi:hypothetical protein HII31_08341 [Pseudocercospora fuligena]|uniref:Uncharacterized protein n=1 Tax=Pseudocercospora fuligena TaxID=685502 RepID=A0A8H6VKG2_9PEZI|nr:hypothetical protein HII31_08341 [Pseudocercospora fuligena]